MFSNLKKWSRSVVSDSLRPHGLQPTRLLRPWDFPGKSTGVGCCFLLQEIFPTQGLNLGLPHCRQMLYHLSHQGSQNRYQMRQSLLWGVKKGDLVWGCSVGSEVGFFLSSQNEWRLEYKNPWISGNLMLAALFSAALRGSFICSFIQTLSIASLRGVR